MQNKKRGTIPVDINAPRDYYRKMVESGGITHGAVGTQNDLTSPDSVARLNDYAAGLKKVMDLEAQRTEMRQKDAAASDASGPERNSSGDVAGFLPASSRQETMRIAQEYESRLSALKTHNSQVLRNKDETGAQQAEVERKYADHSIELERKKRDFQIHAADQAATMTANFMQNLFVATGSKNKALFEMMKAFAMARAMISGAVAVVDAYAWGTFFGGPVLGAAFAAAASAATAAQIAQIASISMASASSSIGAGGSANPSYHGGSTTAYPVPQRLEEKPVQNVTIQIYNPLSDQNWQKIVEDNIIPALNSVTDRNVVLNVGYA